LGGIGAIVTAWIVGFWCIDGCSPFINDGNAFSGLPAATIGLPISIFLAPGVLLVLVVGVLLWVYILRTWPNRRELPHRGMAFVFWRWWRKLRDDSDDC
jgi:hypothetical protein